MQTNNANTLEQNEAAIISDTVSAILFTKTYTQAAEFLKIGRTTLYERLDKYPQIKEAISKTRARAAAILEANTERAAEIIVDDLDNKYNKFNAAKEILDRVGVGVKQGQQTNIQVNVTPIYGGKSVE